MMKKISQKIIIIGLIKKAFLFLALILSSSLNGQIDRSMPEAGPAPQIEFKEPFTTKLSNNLTLMVVVNNKLPRASATLIIDNPPILDKNKSGIKDLVTANMGKGNKYQSKDEFIEEKDFMGSFMGYSSSGGSFSSLSRYFERSMTMFAQGAIYPTFSKEEFEKEKTKLIEALKIDEKNSASIARRVENVIAYGSNHPNSEYSTEATVSNIEVEDVQDYYKNYFKPNNAYLVIIGDVNLENTLSLAEKLFSNWEFSPNLKQMFDEGSVNEFSDPDISDIRKIHVVDVPNAANVEINFQNVIDRKTSDKDYFSANVANRVLGAGPESRLFSVIREEKGYAYGAYSGLPTSNKSKTKFQARTTVRTEVADSAIVEMYNQLSIMRNTPISDEELSNVKSGYFGSFAMSMEEPSTIANQALSIRTENLPDDFYKTFLSNLNNVTKDEVIESSKKFFLIDNAQIVVTGKIRDIIDNLENIYLDSKKVDVVYLDHYGNISDRPDYSVDKSVTVGGVIDRYINAIGGLDKLNKISSIETKFSANIQGTPLEGYSLKNDKNQSVNRISVMGQVMQKTVFNKYQGYNQVMGGAQTSMTEDELEMAIIQSSLFTETKLDYSTIELVGTSVVNNEEVYEVKITDNLSAFYSISSGLKLKEVTTLEVQGNPISQEVFYEDYKEVKGILFPGVQKVFAGPQEIKLRATSIKLNVDTSDSDFE